MKVFSFPAWVRPCAFCLVALFGWSECIAADLFLRWSDNSNTEDGFNIYRSSDGQQYKRIAQTKSNVTKYIDLASLDGSVYWYRVSAYNEHGESGFTNIAKVSIAEAIVENVKDVLEDVLDPIVSEVEDTLSEDTKKEVPSSELDMTDLSVKSLFNDGTYYAGVTVEGSGEVPFLCRIAPGSADDNTILSSWDISDDVEFIGESSTWAREEDANSILSYITASGLFPQSTKVSEPALLHSFGAAKTMNVFEEVALKKGTAIFELADLRTKVSSGARVKEISLMGPVVENGSGFALRFRITDSTEHLYRIAAMIPDIGTKLSADAEPMLVISSTDGRFLRISRTESAEDSANARRSSFRPLPESKVASLSVKLKRGTYFAQLFLIGGRGADTLAALSIVR